MQALATWERELHSLETGTPPTAHAQITVSWLEHFGAMGFGEQQIRRALVDAGDWVDFERAFEALLSDDPT